MLNSSSQKARIFFYFSRDGTEWVCDQENISIHIDAGAQGDVIVKVTLATGALYPRVRHSCHIAHNLNYLLSRRHLILVDTNEILLTLQCKDTSYTLEGS